MPETREDSMDVDVDPSLATLGTVPGLDFADILEFDDLGVGDAGVGAGTSCELH